MYFTLPNMSSRGDKRLPPPKWDPAEGKQAQHSTGGLARVWMSEYTIVMLLCTIARVQYNDWVQYVMLVSIMLGTVCYHYYFSSNVKFF